MARDHGLERAELLLNQLGVSLFPTCTAIWLNIQPKVSLAGADLPLPKPIAQ
jgi:hypothetical protein